MGRLLSIDFGRRRCGIAATDPLRRVANGVATVATASLTDFVKQYIFAESVDAIVVGYPRDLHGQPSESVKYLTPAIDRLKKAIGPVTVIFFDERFEISATILLNDFLQSRLYNETNIPSK